MASSRPTIKLFAVALVIFMVGVVAGAALVAFWSSKASRLYVQMTRFSFASEQELLLRRAWQKGDLQTALTHAACQVVADGPTRAFDPAHSQWHFWFPVFGAGAAERTAWNPARGTNVEALAHAELAAVWERLGRSDAAEREYAEAMRITGVDDALQLRRVALQILNEAPPALP